MKYVLLRSQALLGIILLCDLFCQIILNQTQPKKTSENVALLPPNLETSGEVN